MLTSALAHPVLVYPVHSKRQGHKLARRLQPILDRLTSADSRLATLVTAQAVTITVAFEQILQGDMGTDPMHHLVPTLATLISGIMVNDLVCRHLDAPRRRWGWRR